MTTRAPAVPMNMKHDQFFNFYLTVESSRFVGLPGFN